MSYQKPSCGKKVRDFVQTQGQAQEITRAKRGHFKDKKDKKGHMKSNLAQTKDKPRTKKDWRREATEGKCNFTDTSITVEWSWSTRVSYRIFK